MLSALVSVAVMCAGCAIDEVSAVGARPWEVQAPLIDQQVQDGCARFALKVVNGVATVEALYNTNGCQTDALKLEADSSPVFDSTTGVLRVPVVMRNLGTSPVVAPARIRFNADSSQFINAQGQVIAGTPNIVATNYDTANVSGRSGQWRYDTLLASSGQAQLLMPNAVSRRRWLEFSGSDWSQRVRIKLPTVATVAPTVPAIAPDSVPAGTLQAMRADSNITHDDAPEMSGSFARNVVLVIFKTTATQQQRAAILASVGGTVVGGFGAGGGGMYYVQLAGPSTTQHLFSVIATLRADPNVKLAVPDLLEPISPTYRIPSDGTAFRSCRTLAETAFGSSANSVWGLEAVSAPLAWGCSTGDPAIPISVVDQWFRSDVDLSPNLTQPTPWSSPMYPHGTEVASVLAARGNNGVGATGLMWNASVSLWDRLAFLPGTRSGFEFYQQLVNAGNSGARIINVSSARYWLGTVGRLPRNDTADSTTVLNIAAVFRQAIEQLDVGGRNPLFVVAASNDGVDAFWGGLTQLSADSVYGNQVVVVSAAQVDGSLAAFSNRNASAGTRYATLAAPGKDISVLVGGGSVSVDSGTSFAAPFVSGTAGLLLSLDPSIGNSELKPLLINGALRRGRTISDSRGGAALPLLDVYSSLRLVAERAGAPLCGNRVWASNHAIHVERGSTVETLPVTLPTDSVWNVEVAHGGKQINYEMPGPYGLPTIGTVLWTAGGWVAGPSTEIPDADRGGSNRSVYMRSHGGDSLISVQVSQSTASVDVDVALFGDAGLTQLRSTTIPGLAPAPAANTEPTEWVFVGGAYPQNGGDAVVAVNRMVAANSTGVTQCPNGASVTCQPGAIYYRYYWRPKQTDLYHVNVSSAPMTATHIATIPDSLVYDIAFSEDGKEKLLRMGRDSIYNSGDGVWELHSLVCKQSWSKPTFGTTSTTIPFDSTQARRIVDVFGCASDGPMLYRNGAGTSAPRVGPQRRVTANSG